MSPPDAHCRLPVEQAVDRFRARVVAELRALNEVLPLSRRLERREIDHLVDNLLFALRETPRRRNASLLDKAVWLAGGVLVQTIRRRGRRRKAAGTMARWNQEAADRGERPQSAAGAPSPPLAPAHLDNVDTAAISAQRGRRGVRDHL